MGNGTNRMFGGRLIKAAIIESSQSIDCYILGTVTYGSVKSRETFSSLEGLSELIN